MLITDLSLGEEICNLDLRWKVVEGDRLITNRAPHKVSIHANVLGQLIFDQIGDNLKSTNDDTVKSGEAIETPRS